MLLLKLNYGQLKNHIQYHLKKSLLCSFFVNSFDTLPKQKLYQLMLSFTLNFQICVLFTYK